MRLFYGIEISEDVKEWMASLTRELQRRGVSAANWSAPSLMHVTVVFLGEVPEQRMDDFSSPAKAVADMQSPFQLTLDHVGLFGGSRVLWVGFTEDAGYRELQSLCLELSHALRDTTGFVPDARPFRPHVTLARKLDMKSSPIVGEFSLNGSKQIPVRDLCLFESTRVNGQLVYPVRSRFGFEK